MNDVGAIGTPADVSRSYGLSDFDRKHNYVSSFVYELPFLKNAKGALGAVLGGWQIAGVFIAQSGTPVDIRAGGAALRAPQNQQRPNLNGQPSASLSDFPNALPGPISTVTTMTWCRLIRSSTRSM